MNTPRIAIGTLVVALAASGLAACGSGAPPAGTPGGPPGGAKKGPQSFPVEVATVEKRDVTYTVRAVGGVEAYERVQVTARVSGVVDRVNFTEGDTVAQGATLVELDAARYRILVVQAKAQLQRAKATLEDAQLGFNRRQSANQAAPGTVRDDELEQYRGKVKLAEADVALAQAALDQTEVNLRDANVRAPAGGIIETRSVSTGAYIQPGNVLATLLRREPLLLRFDVPDAEASRIRLGQRVEFDTPAGTRPFRATVFHIAEAADAATRLVTVTARIDDPERRKLRAGAFAQVKVGLGTASSPVVPRVSVRPSELGFLAFVVKDGRAVQRVLRLGLTTEDGLVEVLSGVETGESVVTRGAEALRDGALVQVVSPAAGGTGRALGVEAPSASAPGAEKRP